MTIKMVFEQPPENFNPKVEVAACFITVNGTVLFIKRQAHCSEPGKWGIPGGKLEKGETAHQAVLREIKEETGLHLPSEVYQPPLKNTLLGCVKTPGFNDRKASCISLIQRALRSLNRGSFHVSPKVYFSAEAGIDDQLLTGTRIC
jgi:8-oxo-dGTP pyrophosphatase MutT (NUDIX family)